MILKKCIVDEVTFTFLLKKQFEKLRLPRPINMMKRFLLFCFTILSFTLFAQTPINDDCFGIIDLGVGPNCDSTAIFNNINATASQIFNPPDADNIPSCWDNVNNDVWFQFVVPSNGSIVDFTIEITGDDANGNQIIQPQLAVYRGDCLENELDELLCTKAEEGESTLELDLEGLTPGITYFLRVDDFSATATPNWGEFYVCVDSLREVNTIDEGGSTSCSGELYDTGGPEEDYSGNENFVYTICPPAPNNNCITYNLEYYNLEQGVDVINIFDGEGTASTPISTITGFGAGENWGGVCQVFQASSGCLTIEFVSDGTAEFEGFASNWECSTQACETLSQIAVDLDVDADGIAEIVASPETVVTIDTIICANGSIGTFTADNTDLGLSKGLVLSTGMANEASGNGGFFASTGVFPIGSASDSDLDIISTEYGNGTLSNDACVIELDVFAAGDELTFEYVFGSEEYPEFVNLDGGGFNDIFAFLISGPGIVGDPLLNDQFNMATLPGTNTLVEVNSVNHSTNWEYYRDNLNGQSVSYDGLTSDFLGVKKSLTARSDVIPCNTYHLKLAIADRVDNAWDSGVFISEISGGRPSSSLNTVSGIDYLIEGCSGTDEEIVFFIEESQDDTTTFKVEIGGSATIGTDYILNLPSDSIIVILPGQTSVSFPIIPLTDVLVEGTETISIRLTNDFGCGEITYFIDTINIEDEPVVDILTGITDSAFVCFESGITLEASGAGSYFWTPVSVFPNSNPSSATPFAEPTTDIWVNVIGTVGPCTDEDSVFLTIINPEVTINPITATDICEGTSVSLEAVDNVSGQGLIWAPDDNLANPNAPIISDIPDATTTYSAIVELEGCSDTAFFTVNVDPFDFPELTTFDTTLCESYTFQAAAPILGTTTTYVWLPNQNMDDNTLPNPTIEATAGTTTYTVTATSENAFCSVTESITVTGIPANADINNPDTVFICLGESVDLSANTTTAGVGFNWISDPLDASLDPVTDTLLTVTPTISTTYTTRLEVGACIVFDSIFVRVDSLPDLSAEAIPFKDIYCAGDIVSVVSPTYEPSDFPDIMHQWGAATSIQSDLENLNLVLIMDETTTYTRITTNNACADTLVLPLEVVDPILSLLWTDTTICAGDQVVNMEIFGDDNHTWNPTDGIVGPSDTNTATLAPFTTTAYTVNATIFDCPADPVVATVTVIPTPTVEIIANPMGDVTIGSTVVFTAQLANPMGDETFEWIYNGNVVQGSGDSVSIVILEEGQNNNIGVTVTNGNGCVGIDNVSVIGVIPNYRMPNVFTPDGDGVNDFFNITYENQDENSNLGPAEIVEFKIWNRWGNVVYNNETPNQGWDGTQNGDPSPSDVYVYHIQIRLVNGEMITLDSNTGTPDTSEGNNDVTLIR